MTPKEQITLILLFMAVGILAVIVWVVWGFVQFNREQDEHGRKR